MQNKGAIKLFSILLAITCIFYLSFTYITKGVEKDADAYAASYINRSDVQAKAKAFASTNSAAGGSYIDSVYAAKRDSFLNDLRKKPVFSLGITDFTYEQCKEKEINLGLDLRGGMNVTLEIAVPEIIKSMSNNSTNATFNQALAQAYQRQRTDNRDFVTLFGEEFKKINPNERLAPIFQTIELKGQVEYNTSDNDVLKLIRARVDESIETAEKTLRARIDKFGVTQPNIQKLASSGRILVELPGVSDKKRVRKLLQGTANLEFWETYESSEIIPMLAEANKRLASTATDSVATDSTKISTDTTGTKAIAAVKDTTKKSPADTTKSLASQLKSDTSKASKSANDTTFAAFSKKNPLFAVLRPSITQDEKGAQGYRPGPVVGYAAVTDTAKVNALLKDKQVKSAFPARMKFLWSFKPFDKEETTLELIALRISSRDGKAPLSGDIIADARKVIDQRGGGFAQISMTMTPEAAMTWKKLTGDNIGKSIAIVLDNSVYSFPTVQGEIAGGQSQITGNFTNREADDLVNILKAGKLPAPARIVQEAVVGPTLGKEAINAGLLSFGIALLVVLAYMGFYYNKGGWVADIALFVNVFFVMGVLASLGAVLTLPGIAGLVLTLGLSVDANILIFERIREELRAGKGTAQAIKEGYKGALSSILDSNITTLLLGIILYTFGTGPIQGFATTLIIGILSSLFCAIFISRIIFEGLLKKNKSIRFSVPATENIFRNANINFVGRRKIYYIISTAIIVAGIFSYVQKGGFKLGIDFKGGRSYVVRFDNEKTVEEVRAALSPVFDGAPEVKTFGSGNQQKITTTYKIDDPSEDAEAQVENKLHEGLDKLGVKYQVMSQQKVGETVSNDIRSKAIWAILFSCLIMFIYIFIRFKKWQYGLGATVALFHDVLIVLSCYTLFDGLLPFPLEIDQHFIAAILTVMGYSMTDTVVVFDRIREYLTEKNKTELARNEKYSVINYALNSTLSRTMNTSAITFFVLLAIFIFGGEVIRGFSFALLIGIVIGTYSSLCIATPVVIDFDKKEKDLVPARA